MGSIIFYVLGSQKFIRNTPFVHQGLAGGNLMILGKPCFELEEGLSEVFFSGSLSCNHPPETH